MSDYTQVICIIILALMVLLGAPFAILAAAKLAAYGWSTGLRNFERDNTTHRSDVCPPKKEPKNEEVA